MCSFVVNDLRFQNERILMKEYVLVLCHRINFEHEFLLIEKQRPLNQKGRYNLPGGKVEIGETPQEAAIRELQEETGLVATHVVLGGKIKDVDAYGEEVVIYCYSAFSVDASAPIKPREGETEKVEWVRGSIALSNPKLMTNLRIIIPLLYFGQIGWTVENTNEEINGCQKFEVQISKLG